MLIPHKKLLYRKEEYLLSYWAKFSLTAPKIESIQFDESVRSSAFLQLQRKLYICGGGPKPKEKPTFTHPLSSFYSMNYSGLCTSLASMSLNRSFLSLAGLPSTLIALGGNSHENIKTKACEMYLTRSNKWNALPSLNIARWWPGICLLVSRVVLCFCGKANEVNKGNSVEKLALFKDREWEMIELG